MQHQREETDPRMGSDSIRQAMEDRTDLDLALEHSKAALDVGQTLVPKFVS